MTSQRCRYNILIKVCEKEYAAFNRIVNMVMFRIHRNDDFLYHVCNRTESPHGNFSNLLRQIIDDQDYREVVDNPPTDN